MADHGADWYERYPRDYLGGTVGLTTRQHAVYSIVLDLIYEHGGACPNDPKWISGWFSDLGPASVRRVILELVNLGKLTIDDGKISNKRAKNQGKTREKLRENARKSGRLGAEKRWSHDRNQTLSDSDPITKNMADKTKEDKTKEESPHTPQGGQSDEAEFQSWYSEYPRKVAKGAARRAFSRARKKAGLDELVAGAKRYAEKCAGKQREFIAHPATWLNGERWLDGDPADEGPKSTPEEMFAKRVEVARDWLSRNDDIPAWMDRKEVAMQLVKEGYEYDRLRKCGFSIPPRQNVVDISQFAATAFPSSRS